MGEQIGGFGPRTVLWFHHLHTNELQKLCIVGQAEEGKNLYQVRLKGKPRPMLLLWQGHDSTFHLLLMTREPRHPTECQVMVQCDSFVDCSRLIEYSETALYEYRNEGGTRHTPRLLDDSAWRKVLEKLPKDTRGLVTQVDLGYGLRCGTQTERPGPWLQT
jgi:hypothetical protein